MMMARARSSGGIYNIVSPRHRHRVRRACCSLGSSWMLSHLTLRVRRAGHRRAARSSRASAFACLFVPLTTVALANIPRTKLADATGLNSLMRQIGGSIGLAIFATLFGNYAVVARGGIDPHMTLTRPEVWQRHADVDAGLHRPRHGRGVSADRRPCA